VHINIFERKSYYLFRRVAKTEAVMSVFRIFRKLRLDQEGATAIEYGLIAALIAVAAIAVMTQVGTGLSATFLSVANQL
jgi:pilus assembly protein Flp/PilA